MIELPSAEIRAKHLVKKDLASTTKTARSHVTRNALCVPKGRISGEIFRDSRRVNGRLQVISNVVVTGDASGGQILLHVRSGFSFFAASMSLQLNNMTRKLHAKVFVQMFAGLVTCFRQFGRWLQTDFGQRGSRFFDCSKILSSKAFTNDKPEICLNYAAGRKQSKVIHTSKNCLVRVAHACAHNARQCRTGKYFRAAKSAVTTVRI